MRRSNWRNSLELLAIQIGTQGALEGSMTNEDFDWLKQLVESCGTPAVSINSNLIAYQLPNGQIIHLPYDVCRAASLISYTLKSGRVVDAIILQGER